MPPATEPWQRQVDMAVAVDQFASRYGWDYWTVEAQPVWLIETLPLVWDVRAEVRGGHPGQGQGGDRRLGHQRG